MSSIEDIPWDRSITFYVNGKVKTLHNNQIDPRTTLLCYLRDTIGLTGTKLGCGEGGCGACTVMISYFDKTQQKIRHKSANACLTPVCSIDGLAITTVEGIGGMKKGLLCMDLNVVSVLLVSLWHYMRILERHPMQLPMKLKKLWMVTYVDVLVIDQF